MLFHVFLIILKITTINTTKTVSPIVPSKYGSPFFIKSFNVLFLEESNHLKNEPGTLKSKSNTIWIIVSISNDNIIDKHHFGLSWTLKQGYGLLFMQSGLAGNE